MGRLRAAYPAHSHDVEVRLIGVLPEGELAAVLAAAGRDALDADPRCRRVVFAPAATDLAAVAAAERAGFRHVVDVEIPGVGLSLLALEPAWVTSFDNGLDRVPGT
ncbi:hypothetical protein I6A60_19420 [Frankia sp. AgB1.9]|uniref:hypothetical protein n=1 Tax=unclassified Frankia TaxID=2632575 RepID=UPI0019328305|nr:MULTISPECIES: hypothetical protein [unclassified Frankia]MBL7487654.1 hypothetical protein [Frankia sp. AgW1.1]MBL7550032.1 hypothetical protein [Frankia sp. AgB1.9]MBL7621903.1 hypothetical protein [Frankia sp. AgB1.8]